MIRREVGASFISSSISLSSSELIDPRKSELSALSDPEMLLVLVVVTFELVGKLVRVNLDD